MTETDKDGRLYLNINAATEGMTVWLDNGFTCHDYGPVVIHGMGEQAYFLCDEGTHKLDGQCDEGDYCIGVYPIDPQVTYPSPRQ